MPNEETTQKEIQKALAYLEENGGKQSDTERIKRVTEELMRKAMPKEAVLASILAELQEEKINEEEISQKFGEETLQIINTLKQIDKILQRNYSKLPNETLSSILISLSSDFQSIIIKLAVIADALQNREKIIYEKNYAKIAEEIFFSLATKLGLADYAWKIQDFGFRVENPEGFKKIKKLINKTREEREEFVEKVKKEIEGLLKGKIKAQVSGRPKGFKSIYDKLEKMPFQKINDIYGIRIICNKEKECYEALGYVHGKYEIIPEAFDDYISKPKPDGYKSIHTAVKRGSEIIEVQIRTWEQHLRTVSNQYWAYKKIIKDTEFEKELSWERQLIEWQKSLGNDAISKKISGKKIFVFTPKNEALALPIGATALDFAFAVHTDIGKRAEKAIVNGKTVPVETKLNNLDSVEIITGKKQLIKQNWLNFAITEKAKTKIKAFFGIKKTIATKLAGKNVDFKKIKMAECCHPLPGEDVIGVKTTKRKIICHKKNCPNLLKIGKDKLVEIGFEKEKGKTKIFVTATDRPGVLSEMLAEIRKSASALTNTHFKIKKSGYAEAIFELEVKNVKTLEKLMENIEKIPSVQSVERL